MNSKYKSSLIIKCLSAITILYIVSLLTVTSHDTLYIINRILFFALVAIFIVVVLLNRVTIKLEGIIFSTIPILIMIILSNIWAADTDVSLNRTIGIFFYYLGAIIIYLLVYNKILSINKIFQALLLSVIILSITASYEYYFLGFSRGAGLAENPNNFGLSVVFLCPLIWGIDKLQPKGSKIVRWLIIVALANAIVVSGGRKVLIASILILLFFYLNNGSAKLTVSKYIRIVSLFFMTLLLILLLILNTDGLDHLTGKLNAVDRLFDTEDASVSIRKSMIETSFELFKEKPLVGYGIDNFSVVSPFGTYSHNNYTEVLVSVGVIGFIFYYFMYARIIFYSNKIRIKVKKSEIFQLTFFYLLLILVLEVGLVNINSPNIWFLLIMLIILNDSLRKSILDKASHA